MTAGNIASTDTIRLANGKEMTYRVVTEIPAELFRPERPSEGLRLYLAAKERPDGKLHLEGDPDEILRLYKSLAQWRNRHRELGLQFRKIRNRLYVWVQEPQ